MSDLIASTARLVPYAKRPKHANSFVTAYVYEPAADDIGAKLGNLYVVVEVLVSGRASEEVVDLIIQSTGDKYYNDQDAELDPLSRFEAAIKQTNHELSEYVGRGNAAWIGKLSAVIAVLTDTELHVAQTGSAEAFLYRGKAASRITQAETPRPVTPSKTFGSIATGELEISDKILFSTPALIHQIPLTKLQSVITTTGPNTAIAELSQLLAGSSTGRIAALVVELTTPELAALKVRSDEPEEIQLSNGENIAEVAIRAAAPLAQTTAEGSKKAVAVASNIFGQFKPRFNNVIFAVVQWLRQTLSTRRGKKRALIAIGLALMLLIAFIFVRSGQQSDQKQFDAYQNLFGKYAQAQSQAQNGDKTAARSTLVAIQSSLQKLNSTEASLNKQLKNNPLAEGEPTSVAGFKALVSNQIDQLDGLVKVTAKTIAQIGTKNSKPSHFETDGTKAYVIDTANSNKIVIVSLLTGDQKDSKVDSSKLGNVINTTLSPSNDGMFILTSAPSVWHYRFASDTLQEQTLAYGQWPKSSAIASYGSNLYLLGDQIIYKHIRNSTGYSPKTDYISTTSSTTKYQSLAVDGWVYAQANDQLHRYLGSALKQTIDSPDSVKGLTNLRSTADGKILIATAPASSRIALWQTTDTNVSFDKQITIDGAKKLYDATYVAKLGEIFATVDNKLVSFKLPQ